MEKDIKVEESTLVSGLKIYSGNPAKNTANVRKTRVAAYCRVSTDLECQESSIKLQMETFKSTIESNPDWEIVDIYADKGLTGRNSNRHEFQRMIKDAVNGKIDLILTKSTSRFARNTLDTLKYTRLLKEKGVGVYFDEQNLDTRNEFSEMLLTIHAAFAQEESRSLSENYKQGVRKRYEMGIPRYVRVYGYGKGKEGIEIIEDEAKVVRRIFDAYIKGDSLPTISRDLNDDGIPTIRKGKWSACTVGLILRNEKYMGDVAMQKWYIEDFLTRKQVKNTKGELPKYYKQNNHPAIVDREVFMISRVIAAMKDKHRGCSQYPYFGFLKCPYCGKNMISLYQGERHGHKSNWTCMGENAARPERKYRSRCPAYLVEKPKIDEGLLDALRKKKSRIDYEASDIEYIFLYQYVDEITFDVKDGEVDWSRLIVRWKDGERTIGTIKYEALKERPAVNPRFENGVYYDGDTEICKRGGSSINAYNGAKQRNKFCEQVKIYEEPKVCIIEGMPDLGTFDMPIVITTQTIKEVDEDGRIQRNSTGK